MLEELLTRDDCANCKICCKFEEDELIDAPVFSKNQVEYIKKNIDNSIDFEEKNGTFQIKLTPYNNKYICTKFARCLLGVLKVTQDNPPEKWKYVPMQDFTVNSDIDWSQSVAGIDRQLYAKYGLDEREIEFIETHVKEMK